MITFDKINDAYANILNDGKQIGRLYKEPKNKYIVEVNYMTKEDVPQRKVMNWIKIFIKVENKILERQKRIMSYEWKDFKKFRVKE